MVSEEVDFLNFIYKVSQINVRSAYISLLSIGKTEL